MDANVPAQQISVQAVIMQNNSDISLSDQIRSSITEYAEHSKTNSVHHASIKNKHLKMQSMFHLQNSHIRPNTNHVNIKAKVKPYGLEFTSKSIKDLEYVDSKIKRNLRSTKITNKLDRSNIKNNRNMGDYYSHSNDAKAKRYRRKFMKANFK